jgi:uncharacterized membrane protein
VIIGIFALPVALPIAIAVLSVGIGLLISVFAVVAALIVTVAAVCGGGVIAFIAGAGVLFVSVPTGLFYMGGGLAAAGVALLLGVLVFAAARALVGGVARLLNSIRVKSRERHERKAGERSNG